MKPFLNKHFLLENKTAEHLYHQYAADLPIIDYHNHLPPDEVAADKIFTSITEVWLKGDHYKWRAMRANGIDEQYITGDADDKDKFLKWAATVPYTMRNPLYHWTHLELQRYFGISDLLNETNGAAIFEKTTAQLQQENFSTQNLLKIKKVEVICTTDDPTDSLEHHQTFQKQSKEMKMLPTFRPDKFLQIEKPAFLDSIEKLRIATNRPINNLRDLVEALQDRIDFFHSLGGRLADHGLSRLHGVPFTDNEVDTIFQKRLRGSIFPGEAIQFQSALLYYLGRMYHAKGWTMQFHLGAIRNNNERLLTSIGADVGCDSIGDFEQATGLSRFLNRLDKEDKLAKTVLYNLNPRDNEVFATMAGNFNDGRLAGKIQWGSAWWFLDQKDGMEKQINTLSNMGLLSRFLGMLTDSRSFLLFPRHEYFRRILCNLIGKDIEKGELPNDIKWLVQMVENICYYNAKNYFNF